MTSTLYRELLWIVKRAGVKFGWARYRFLDMTGREPEDRDRKGTPVRPSEATLLAVRPHLRQHAYNNVVTSWSDSMLRNDARRALDVRRPKLEDL